MSKQKQKASGRAKQKQKAQKKSPGKVPFAKQFAKGQLFDDDEPSGPMFRGFTQRSGQNTPQTSAMKLRHQAISFVSASASPSTPAEQEKDTQMLDDEAIAAALAEQADDLDESSEDDDEEDDDIDDSAMQTNILEDTDADIAQGTEALHIDEPVTKNSSMSFGLDGIADVNMAPATTPAPMHEDKPPTPPHNDEPSFFIDTVGDPTLATKFKSKSKSKAPVRAASPTPSDSSGDEIIFRGRKATVIDDPYTKPKTAPQPRNPDVVPPHRKREPHVTDSLLAALDVSIESSPVRAPPAIGWGGKPFKGDSQLEAASDGFTPAPEGSWWRKKGMPRPDLGPSRAKKMALDAEASSTPRKTKVGFAEPEEELGAEDTIASLQAEWKDVKNEKKRAAMAQRELDEGSEAAEQHKSVNRAVAHQLGVKTSRRGKRGRKRHNQLLRDLDSDDSDEDLAMARDYIENLKAQGEDIDTSGLRSADGGPSLVVDGNVIGEDELLDDSMRDIDPAQLQFVSGSSDSDSDIIGQDLSELDDDEDDMNASDYDSSDLEVDLEYDEREQWEDEEDLRRRRIEAMDDEMIARLFHKQAELGIDSDELVIDDGTFVDDVEGVGDLDEARAGLEDLTNISLSRSATRPARRGGKKGFSFPDASALADAVDQYGDNGFDIMDYDRPSLRPTKKGRKGKMPPELEAIDDEELRANLRGAWDNDRAKKSLKKQEREELRMQGLLGSSGKKGKADLNQKYLQGMTLVQVHEELRIFLQDNNQEVRSFPPMLKEDRAALHAIASRLNLTSKSQGVGKKRFPMLYKTNRTPDYNEAQFRRILAASERGFLKNSSYKAKGGAARGGAFGGRGGRGGARGGRGGTAGGHGLRDGEEVGANAKEIGKENFGHRLMEKMGWTKGTALGKDGSGLLVPVAQVMKTGRGGLG